MVTPADANAGSDGAETSETRLPFGGRVGPYRITARIGGGGMGEVFEAIDTRLNRKVAIKMLPAHVADDPLARERFEWEARAIAALSHPHICTLYDVGHEDGREFLVMEHLEGRTLAGPVPIADALEIAMQIADALESAHERGILHRDLKPSNVVWTKSGAKLLDFGLAKSFGGEHDPGRTMAGTVVGTVAYMSPEQAEGKPLDARSDMFSFGAVLYELIGGRRAFSGPTSAATLTSVLRDEPQTLTAPPALQQIVRRCLAKEPSQRFSSMADVKDALGRVNVAVTAKPSIAVLPFASFSADPENEYFSDGISEEIINVLSQIEGLHVAARTSSFGFKATSLSIGEIAAKLNVGHVLEGSVRRSTGRVRVTAQLIEASSGFRVWSERYDRDLADIFDVQDEIARAIVERLRVALSPGAHNRLAKITTENVDAYQQYLKGRTMLYRRGAWITRALESFQTAVALDTEYAQAWAGVADAYTTLSYTGLRRPDQTMPAALGAATRATRLDPDSAEAHNALAIVALLWERDFEKAGREFREALRLNPQYLQARCWYGLFYLQWGIGQFEEGLIEAQRAADADPLSSYATLVLSFCLATVGRRHEAVEQSLAAVKYDPESFLARWQLGLAFLWNKQAKESIEVLEPLWNESGHNWAALGLAPAYAGIGNIEGARRLYETLRRRSEAEYVPPLTLAICESALGDTDAAIASCESGIGARDTTMALFLRWWPELDRLRADPRFPGIVSRFNARASDRS
jgi:serine/threonine-protein kinase